MGWVGTVSSQMNWQRLPVAPLYADVWAYCSHVKMYCKRARLLSSHPRLFSFLSLFSLTSSFLTFVVIGSILIYVIPSVCFVVLVIIGCCVYCLCCRKRKQKSYEREDRKMQRRREEIKQRHAERRAERKMRTDAIRQKYGLLANEDDAEVAWTDLKYWFQHFFIIYFVMHALSIIYENHCQQIF